MSIIENWKTTLAAALLITANGFEPARFKSGSLPVQPPKALGGGQVLFEVTVEADGAVSEIATLRSTPPYTEALQKAVSHWRFHPAREIGCEELEEAVAVQSKVLVAGVFRPSTFYDGPSPGEVPEEGGLPSTEVPFPTIMASPRYPPTAIGYGGRVLLVEVEVGEGGKARAVKVVLSASGFDSVSIEAARQWRFRPAQRRGGAVASFAYIVFGFREPVTLVKPRNGPGSRDQGCVFRQSGYCGTRL
jgi:TonB family protein